MKVWLIDTEKIDITFIWNFEDWILTSKSKKQKRIMINNKCLK